MLDVKATFKLYATLNAIRHLFDLTMTGLKIEKN